MLKQYIEMDWNYFAVDGRYKFKRLPKPPSTISIKDISESPFESHETREMKEMSNSLSEYNNLWKERYKDWYVSLYEIEVEEFGEYFDRNLNKFLGNLKIFKGYYYIIEELFFWWYFDGYSDGIKGSIGHRKTWKLSWIQKDTDFTDEDKIFQKFIDLNFVEISTTTDEVFLQKYITEDAKVKDLNTLAKENNITLKGKKDEKITLLLDALQKGLIINTSFNVYRPTITFDKWINGLQSDYIDRIEEALKTFNYPDLYIANVWSEAININGAEDFPLIKSLIEIRQKKYINILNEVDAQEKKETEDREQRIKDDIISGKRLIIKTVDDITREKVDKAMCIIYDDTNEDIKEKLESIDKQREDEFELEWRSEIAAEEEEAKKEEQLKFFTAVIIVATIFIIFSLI